MRLNADGTIRFDDIDQTLRRPTIGELWRFEDEVLEAYQAYEREATRLAEKVAAAAAESPNELPDDLAELARTFRRRGFLDHFGPFYLDVFETLGKPLSARYEDWPVEFLSSDTVREMLDHWKMNPKASGETPPE